MTQPTPVLKVPVNAALECLANMETEHYMLGNPLAIEDVPTREALRLLAEATQTLNATITAGAIPALGAGFTQAPLKEALRLLNLLIGWTDYHIVPGTTGAPNATDNPNSNDVPITVTDRAGGSVSTSTHNLVETSGMGPGGRPYAQQFLPLAVGNYRLFSNIDQSNMLFITSDAYSVVTIGPAAQLFTIDTPSDPDHFPQGLGFFDDFRSSPTSFPGSMCLQYLGVGGTIFEPTA